MENFPELPRTNECYNVVVKHTDNSPAKSLTVLQVAVARESTLKESEETNEERVFIASQQ